MLHNAIHKYALQVQMSFNNIWIAKFAFQYFISFNPLLFVSNVASKNVEKPLTFALWQTTVQLILVIRYLQMNYESDLSLFTLSCNNITCFFIFALQTITYV